jgi:hypothetical protein
MRQGRQRNLRYPQCREQTSGMNSPDPVYLELVDFVAAGSTPEEVAEFHRSLKAQARVAELGGARKVVATNARRRR